MDFVRFDGSQCTILNMPEAPDSNECARPSQNTSQQSSEMSTDEI